MRGKTDPQGSLFFSINMEERIRPDHSLRAIKHAVEAVLGDLTSLLEGSYSKIGRPSVPPERLLKASLQQCLYSVRSERQLVERLDTDLLFRWFCDMDPAEPVFDATAFTHNRERLQANGIVAAFFEKVVTRGINAGLTSDEHFSVDGTLIESYASIKSFKPKDDNQDNAGGDSNGFKPRNAEVNFHGQKRSNATHRSTIDGEARLYRKGDGQPAKLCHMGHAITENRNGLIMAVTVTEANGRAEPAAAVALLDELRERHRVRAKTVGEDRGYDSGPHLLELERRGITPHVAMLNKTRDPETVRPCQWEPFAARVRMRQRQKTPEYAISPGRHSTSKTVTRVRSYGRPKYHGFA